MRFRWVETKLIFNVLFKSARTSLLMTTLATGAASGILFTSSPSWALSQQFRQQLNWEYYANSANDTVTRPPQEQQIHHYEVPVELLSAENGFALDLKETAQINKSLYFEKEVNGQKKTFVRWIINPEDTEHHIFVKKVLEKNNLDSNPKKYFNGYMTSSRSIYIEDPQTGTVFSAKVSTNITGGRFKEDKKMHKWDILSSQQSNTLAKKIIQNNGQDLKSLVLLQEPVGLFMEKGTYQGFLIRSLQPMNNQNYYLPGFAALNEAVGREIARKNGSDDPLAFWNKHYAEPLGKAMAEFAAHFGYSLTSAHNQQFLIELDPEMKPTGKIVLRDFGDAHLYTGFFQRSHTLEDQELYSFYYRFDKRVRDDLNIYFGLFHGMAPPSWINFKKGQQKLMAETFYKNFDSRFSELTGIPLASLLKRSPKVNPPPRYSIKSYNQNKRFTPEVQLAWEKYLSAVECFHGATITTDGRNCRHVLEELKRNAQASLKLEDLVPQEPTLKCRRKKGK